MIVVPTGDGNLLSGMWKGWRELQAVGLIDRLPKIDCAQSKGSDAISRTVRGIGDSRQPDWASLEVAAVEAHTVADSISVDRPRDGLAAVRAIFESGGMAVTIPDAEILKAIPEMAAASGVFAEPAAAAAWAAVKRMVAERQIAPDELVVCLVSGNGLKDITHATEAVGRPNVIDPTLAAVESALASARG